VFDAALRRAGVIRLYNLGQLFAAANALFSHFRPRGNRLAIITNGGGPGVMAADRAADLRIPLASSPTPPSPSSTRSCRPTGPTATRSTSSATPTRSVTARPSRSCSPTRTSKACSPSCPQAMSSPTEVAQQIIEIERAPTSRCSPAGWVKSRSAKAASSSKAGIPTFRTPEPAVELFGHISAYYRNQKLLVQTPVPVVRPQPAVGRERPAGHRNRPLRAPQEPQRDGIQGPAGGLPDPHRPDRRGPLGHRGHGARRRARPAGGHEDRLPSITHKADTGGVRLNLNGLAAVRSAYQEILEDVKRKRPDAVINGVAIEPMIVKPYGRELMVGAFRDPIFGPVITFGEGGAHVEIQADRAVALPPLNNYLVQDLIKSTRIATLLGEYRNMPPINMESLEFVLLRISEMVCELPWIREIDINPLIVDETARWRSTPASSSTTSPRRPTATTTWRSTPTRRTSSPSCRCPRARSPCGRSSPRTPSSRSSSCASSRPRPSTCAS
jgi:acetyltransferase